VEPHAVPSHVGVEFGSVGHGVQDAPHDAMLVFESHELPPQRCDPPAHVMPQLVPSHVGVPMPTTGPWHGVHEEPHVAVSPLLEHVTPSSQLW
jgi:hypothetical protein